MSGVVLRLRREGGLWFGVADSGGRLAATSVADNRQTAERVLVSCMPRGTEHEFDDGPSEFADGTARMLAAIEAGDESAKRFALAEDVLGARAAAIYRLAAAIPPGYACSYGRLAAASGTTAREVGRCMSTNPLYPLVPCHRVVGSDYSLVGYRGATGGPDLDDKLARLRAEARGFRDELAVEEGLVVFPVERVVEKADIERRADGLQPTLW